MIGNAGVSEFLPLFVLLVIFADPAFAYDLGRRPMHDIGLAYCILCACSIIPTLGMFSAVAALICWIIYRVKLAEYKNKLFRAASY